MRLGDFSALTFDCYGTLIDWETGILAALRPWTTAHGVEVGVDYAPAERGCPTRFQLILKLPERLAGEQVERLRAIAAKCPVHRTLEGEVMFDERVERVALTS